ncbi:bifunctional coenzyme A synthase isoform X3 [Narcine bancroftii]|uniref:bifunctional coenzyme A synthase isoform X3 n=1 Tax=Narcine bancroftii TaxID=1343680 RepID=UPI0038321238
MALFQTGVLVLTSPLPLIPLHIAPVLTAAAKIVKNVLYVHLHPGLGLAGSHIRPVPAYIPANWEVSRILSNLYTKSFNVCSFLDVRVVLSNIKNHCSTQQPFSTVQKLSEPPEVVLTDYSITDSNQSNQVLQCLEKYILSCYTCKPNLRAMVLSSGVNSAKDFCPDVKDSRLCESIPNYSDVVLGGTFDRLHCAHKILLSLSCLLTGKRLLIGVADGELLNNKVLKELIEPYQDRVEKALQELAIHKISLVKDFQRASDEEEKLSSSTLRKRLLGSLLVPPKDNPRIPRTPYVIGLTGSTGSGKTSVMQYLQKMGAAAINVDAVSHESYRPGGAAHQKIVQQFGQEILQENGTINRTALGKIVFADEAKLKCLSSIVWPETAILMKQMIGGAAAEGKSVCVLDAALLLEAGWIDMVHEVWVVIVPEDEALRRIVKRDNISEEDAKKRLASQWTNDQRVQKANVVICTQWEPSFTEKQVQKAWQLLQNRLPTC